MSDMKPSHWTSHSREWVVCSCEWVICWIHVTYIHIWTSHSVARVVYFVFFFFFPSYFIGLFHVRRSFLEHTSKQVFWQHTSKQVMSRIHVWTRSHGSPLLTLVALEWVMAHMYSRYWTSHVTYPCMNEARRSLEWVMAHRYSC